jgi:N-dimethylarginine dimethylaminohydrolase
MMTKIYMNLPVSYDILYSINPWMSTCTKPDINLAKKQWRCLYDTIKSWDVELIVLENKLSPDSVFIADAGLIYGKKFILSNFKFVQRKNEIKYWKEMFIQEYDVVDISNFGRYEGSGDSFIIKDFFICGYGHRTCKNVAERIGDIIETKSIALELVDDNFFHLDTCLAFIDDDHLLFYPKAISNSSLKNLENNFNCYDISEKEAFKFGCNFVKHNKKLIVQEGCYEVRDIAYKHGFAVHFLDLSEFLKAGGGAKCLTLMQN